jgi:hypothetical protein
MSFDGSNEHPSRLPRSVAETFSGVETATAASTDMPGACESGVGIARIEADAHGETAHDLGEIAGGVVGRYQRKFRPGGW